MVRGDAPEAPHHVEALLVFTNSGGLQKLFHCCSHLLDLLPLFLFCVHLWRLLQNQAVQVEPCAMRSCQQHHSF